MNSVLRIAAVGAVALLAGCTGTPRPGPVDVTRFHLGSAIAGGSVAVEPMATNQRVSPEYQTYADAVAAELARLGYAPAAGEASAYIVGVSFQRTSRGTVRKRPPITIGIGGGSFGGNVGVGGGASFGIGGGTAELIATELWVQLRRRGDNTVVWEGRAITEAISGSDGMEPVAERLARALFKGFPGESGITITVK